MSRSLIHGHTCCECEKLRGCLKQDCEIRANTKLEMSYCCGCVEEPTTPSVVSIREMRDASSNARELVTAQG